MAGFRVASHLFWRGVPPLEAPRQEVAPTADSPRTDPVAALEARVRALGPVGYPARVYDKVFGRFETQGRAFLAIRFVLVLATVLLLLGGAQGTSILDTVKGDFRPITHGATINLYLAPHAATRYPIQVMDSGSAPSALFGYDQGVVRLPPEGDSHYGFRFRVVRYDPQVEPVVLLSVPGDGYHRLRPASDDGVTIRFSDQDIPTTGVYALLLTSTKSIGHVDLHIQLTRAEVLPVETFQPDWVPLVAGLGLGTLMVGAYTPGAAVLREIRRLASM